MNKPSRIGTDIDFDRPGEQRGFLRLPYSTHASAYGWIGIPVVVYNNGPGPSVLLSAGNHGDEYEGQVALMKLCRTLRADAVRGRLIILPAMNFPAARAGMRTSPVDGGNLNRSFPGDPDGSPTAMIAHYVESYLLTLVDYAFDLHSGGSSLLYLPSATGAHSDDQAYNAKVLELLKVFAAPTCYVSVPQGEDRTFAAAAERQKVISIGTELGGAGLVTPTSMAVAERGVKRLLHHIGSVPGIDAGPEPPPSRVLWVGDSEYFVYSPDYGLFEPLAELGDEVRAGQPAAAVHFPETPWREPELACFQHHGLAICKRVPGRVERGDCLFHLATDADL